jgi:hypothetical protein
MLLYATLCYTMLLCATHSFSQSKLTYVFVAWFCRLLLVRSPAAIWEMSLMVRVQLCLVTASLTKHPRRCLTWLQYVTNEIRPCHNAHRSRPRVDQYGKTTFDRFLSTIPRMKKCHLRGTKIHFLPGPARSMRLLIWSSQLNRIWSEIL